MSKLTSVKKKIHYKLQITNYLLQSIEEVPILCYRVYIYIAYLNSCRSCIVYNT